MEAGSCHAVRDQSIITLMALKFAFGVMSMKTD